MIDEQELFFPVMCELTVTKAVAEASNLFSAPKVKNDPSEHHNIQDHAFLSLQLFTC